MTCEQAQELRQNFDPLSLKNQTPSPFMVLQYMIGSGRNLVYLVIEPLAKKAALVDPGPDLSEPLSVLKENDIELCQIWLTHTHYDHIGGVPYLTQLYKDIEIYVGKPGDKNLKTHHAVNRFHPDQSLNQIKLGNHFVKVILTPGHTPEGVCYWIPQDPAPLLITGDTLFLGTCGRTDFAGGSDLEMFESLQKIKTFEDKTLILPGHHYSPPYSATLGYEKKHNPCLNAKTVQELIALP